MNTDEEEEVFQSCAGELVEWGEVDGRVYFYVAHEDFKRPVLVRSGDRFRVVEEVSFGQTFDAVYLMRIVNGVLMHGFVRLPETHKFYPFARIDQRKYSFYCLDSRLEAEQRTLLRAA
jgi:hypothetical protein